MADVTEKPLEVIYNSICPVCDAGVCEFKKRLKPSHRNYVWLDINEAPERLAAYGVGLDDVRLKIHTIDRDGTLKVGMPAVTSIWLETPGYKWLGRLTQVPVIKQISAVGYNITAWVLYRWNTSKGRW